MPVPLNNIKDALRAGDLAEARTLVIDRVRGHPSEAASRFALVEILAACGEWDRAASHLNVAGELDPKFLLSRDLYGGAIRCEAFRAEVFEGKRTPVIFGHPEDWIAIQLEALCQSDAASELRTRACELAPATPGQITFASADGERTMAFSWLADADSRFGPMLELILEGRYYWVPLQRVQLIEIEAPSSLVDLMWAQARIKWSNDGDAFGLIPVRYAGSESTDDDAIRLARKTEWMTPFSDTYHGLGQRVLMSDAGDHALLDVRRIALECASDPETGEHASDG